MSQTPKTIQIFLPHGDPQGIRVADVTTRIVQVIEVPRSLLDTFLTMSESTQVAFYLLFGESEDEEPMVYIGQTGDLKARLKDHNKKRDFWDRAMVVTSKTNSLTQTHTLFLEWYCLAVCRAVGRYADDNGNSGSKPYTPAPLEADCQEIYDTAKTLLSTLGFPIFEPLAQASTPEEQELFYCRRAESDGKCLYTAEGFVVLAGSSGLADSSPSLAPAYQKQRQRLLEQGVAQIEANKYVFAKDYLFKSPSGAAAILIGRPANGWIEWKAADGRTLDELKRQ